MLKVYITDIAAYNSGRLIGEWVTLPISDDELKAKIENILAIGTKFCDNDFQNEEIFITDYEFENEEFFKVNEYDNVFSLNEEMQLIVEEVEPSQHIGIKFLLDDGIADSISDAISKLDNLIIYENYSMREIAEDFVEEYLDLSGVSDLIKYNLDYDGIARDLESDYIQYGNNIFQYLG